jgi:hypothetical protein
VTRDDARSESPVDPLGQFALTILPEHRCDFLVRDRAGAPCRLGRSISWNAAKSASDRLALFAWPTYASMKTKSWRDECFAASAAAKQRFRISWYLPSAKGQGERGGASTSCRNSPAPTFQYHRSER